MIRLRRLWRYINWRLGNTGPWMMIDTSTHGSIFQDITFYDVIANMYRPKNEQRFHFTLYAGDHVFLKQEVISWLSSRGPYLIGRTKLKYHTRSEHDFVGGGRYQYYIAFCFDYEENAALFKLTFV